MAGKNYVVVGGSNGIGLEIVRQLAAENNQVFVLSRSNEFLNDLPGVSHLRFDAIQDTLDTKPTVDAETAVLPEVLPDVVPDVVHGLAYCPGSINLKSFRSLSLEQFREDFELNVLGAVKVIQALTNALKKGASEKTSSVLLFSTVAVQQGLPMHASVAACKGAIEGLTRTLAAELAPKVRVNCVAPALTETKLTERFFADDSKANALADRYPLKRTGTAEELAAISCFLLTEQSDWITGQVMGVDGGMSTVRK